MKIKIPPQVKRLSLNIRGLDDSLAHEELIKLLKDNNLFKEQFLYRGSDLVDEIRILLGKRAKYPRNISGDLEGLEQTVSKNSIDCYTIKQMNEIAKGNVYLKSPIYWATGNPNPAVLVYLKNKLVFIGERSDFEYYFVNQERKINALAGCIILE